MMTYTQKKKKKEFERIKQKALWRLKFWRQILNGLHSHTSSAEHPQVHHHPPILAYVRALVFFFFLPNKSRPHSAIRNIAKEVQNKWYKKNRHLYDVTVYDF